MYYLVFGFLWLLSLLPLRVLYFISDGIYGLVFYLFKYRRKIVMSNLLIAFPEKTEKERLAIAKKFYHNLIDMFVETIKMVTASNKYLAKRVSGNMGILNEIYPGGRSVQIHVGHNFNWEWANLVLQTITSYQLLAVYMPLTSKVMDRFFLKMRTRNGAIFLRATHMKQDFLPYANTQYVLGLIADQSPGHPENAWWIDFFGRKTPFVKGPAKAAIATNSKIVFAFIHKPRRGYYDAVFSVAVEEPQQYTEQQLTKMFANYLEDVIRQYPEMWLWSHRRWKHEWREEYRELIVE